MRVALLVLRGISIVVGLAAIAGAIYTVFDPVPVYSDDDAIPSLQTLIAQQMTLLCIGLPLALPHEWSIGRGWRWALALGLVAWFGPMFLEGDWAYGFALRMFASLVAVSVLAVWRTLFSLTRP